jgi:predicted NodU family carbamoyl transferase
MTCGAALVVDGRVVAAVNEERLNRKKMCWGFPTLSIAEVLRIAGVSTADVDRIAVAGVDLFWRPDAVTVEDYFRKEKTRAGPTRRCSARVPGSPRSRADSVPPEARIGDSSPC